MAEDIAKLKHIINYVFTNKALLRKALTHRSYSVENNLKYDNQRLEFLGDAVLEILLTEYLYMRYKSSNEGKLTQMRAAMVQQDALAQLARKLHLGDFMLIGKGEKETGGRDRDSTLSDLFEALTGAFYLDAGLERTREFIIPLMEDEFPNPRKLLGELNPKGTLQEYSQRKWNCAPDYEILEVSGPDHDPSYKVQVSVHRHFKAIGEAKNRKQAESEAARKAIHTIAKTDKTLSGLL